MHYKILKQRRSARLSQHALSLGLVLILVSVGLRNNAQALASEQGAGPIWSFTGNLNTARSQHTATLLPNGKVLVVAGGGSSAELYDPAKGTWSSAGNLTTVRYGHTATLLPNGKVLVVGGSAGPCLGPDSPDCFSSNTLTSAELYDPTTGMWSTTASLNISRARHTATQLPNGKVLIAGGYNSDEFYLSSAELYDPATGTWSTTGNLNIARASQVTMVIPNGKVLIAGGFNSSGGPNNASHGLNSTELYDPAIGLWSSTGSLITGRGLHTATLLGDGTVLVVGGSKTACFDPDCIAFDNNNTLTNAELYDPARGLWSSTGSLSTSRARHTATVLPSAKVLVVGGLHVVNVNGQVSALASAELYDPVSGTWSDAAGLHTGRYFHTATLLLLGKLLALGGVDDSFQDLNTAELCDPAISNQIDEAQFFVSWQYHDFLNREPDANGLAYWTNRITECGSDARCIHERRLGVSAAFFIELEFQDTGYYVYRFYKTSFGRQPNYTEFTSDRGRVSGGPNLEASKQAFADEWVQRAAFRDGYPNTLSNTEVVNKLFDSAGLTASTYDALRQQEILAMNAGRSRALVLRDAIEIPDFKNIPDPSSPRYAELKQTSQYNPAFVLMQYFGYLHRDLDRTGYDFWLDVVNNREPNNYPGMVCSFITSSEYQLRFGSVVTRSNADCAQVRLTLLPPG